MCIERQSAQQQPTYSARSYDLCVSWDQLGRRAGYFYGPRATDENRAGGDGNGQTRTEPEDIFEMFLHREDWRGKVSTTLSVLLLPSLDKER